jgi:pilus assembly protein Flp/PilA
VATNVGRKERNVADMTQLILKNLLRFETSFNNLVMNAKRDDKGATAVEYALIVGLIAVAIIGVVGFLGDEITILFQEVLDALKAI